MAKEITGYVKLQVKAAGQSCTPIGPALGSKGINIMEFCKQFNARTQDKMGKVLPVLITVYTDKVFRIRHQNSSRSRSVTGSSQNSKRFQRA